MPVMQWTVSSPRGWLWGISMVQGWNWNRSSATPASRAHTASASAAPSKAGRRKHTHSVAKQAAGPSRNAAKASNVTPQGSCSNILSCQAAARTRILREVKRRELLDAQLLRPTAMRFRHWEHCKLGYAKNVKSQRREIASKGVQSSEESGSCWPYWPTPLEQHTSPYCGRLPPPRTFICPYVGGLSDPGSLVNENSRWLLLN